MITITDNKITINAGDEDDLFAFAKIAQRDENSTVRNLDYELKKDEFFTLTVKKRPIKTLEALMTVYSDPGSNRLHLEGKATEKLKPGKYSADLELTRSDGTTITIWPVVSAEYTGTGSNWENFIVNGEVT